MLVPDIIQKQQSNVLANIGLLRDWGLLIEELKDLRGRAAIVGVRSGHSELFDEVDAMVDLADQEAESDGRTGIRSPTSSQAFSEDEFDQMTPPRHDSGPRLRKSPTEMLRVMQRNKPVRSSPRIDSPEAFQRPRQDSEAMARSVIEALQRWRKPDAPLGDGTAKKVPFDTATLRHILPHVNNLKRRVKDVLRDAEGLGTSSDKLEDESHHLAQLMQRQQLGDESPGAQKEQRMRLRRGQH